MVDVSAKSATLRTASAKGTVVFPKDVFTRVMAEGSVKGDIVTIAKLAGILAAKRTSDLIPLCHHLQLDSVHLLIQAEAPCFHVQAQVTTAASKTGVEMEALTAVSVACLTIYDMTKSYSHAISIQNITLNYKTGGKSDFEQAH